MKAVISNLKNVENGLFSCFVLFFLGLGWLSIILTIFNIFYTSIIIAYLIVSVGFFVWIFWKKEIKLKINKTQLIVFLIILAASLVFSYYSSPTIFSGRDQGSFSEAAIRLSQNHQLEFSNPASEEFFQIYGLGKALNFPGFDYLKNGNLTTHFPIGYISWLASFFSVFGYFGLKLANIISLVIFVFSFYLLTEKFSKKIETKFFILGIVLTSFVFYWFSKFTLSENLAWMLVWFGVYKFWNFWKNEKKQELILSLISFGLFLFVRIEAIAFLVVIFGLLFKRYWKNLKKIFNRNFNYFILAISLIYIGAIYINRNFYFSVLKSFIKPFLKENEPGDEISWFNLQFYLGNVFSLYSMMVIIAVGIIGIIYLLKEKKYNPFIPILIVLPSFYYLLVPNISLDHPWMLRRFAFTIYPAFIFLAFIFLDYFFKKKIYIYVVFFAIFLANSLLIISYLPFVPHQELSFNKTNIFSKKDLVLVDRMTTGDPYSMISGPLSFQNGINSVYFFNPEDLKKINLDRFEKIYFIIPDKSIGFYQENQIWNNLKIVSDYKVLNKVLEEREKTKQEIIKENLFLPFKNDFMLVYGGIYEYQK